jgi:hypothetical protein
MGKVAFESEINGHRIILDASKDSGGENRGPIPPSPLYMNSVKKTGSMTIKSGKPLTCPRRSTAG